MAIDVWLQALAQSHFLKERGCFPPRVKDPTDIAHFFFQACAIEMTAPQLAVVAATLAGIGKCPTTNKECFSTDVSRTLLSLLYSCGMTSVSVWHPVCFVVRRRATLCVCGGGQGLTCAGCFCRLSFCALPRMIVCHDTD